VEQNIGLDPQQLSIWVNCLLLGYVEEKNTEAFDFFTRLLEKTIDLARGRMEEALKEPAIH
jgi:hypothetical protein